MTIAMHTLHSQGRSLLEQTFCWNELCAQHWFSDICTQKCAVKCIRVHVMLLVQRGYQWIPGCRTEPELKLQPELNRYFQPNRSEPVCFLSSWYRTRTGTFWRNRSELVQSQVQPQSHFRRNSTSVRATAPTRIDDVWCQFIAAHLCESHVARHCNLSGWLNCTRCRRVLSRPISSR